jgi:hypothetical protein
MKIVGTAPSPTRAEPFVRIHKDRPSGLTFNLAVKYELRNTPTR